MDQSRVMNGWRVSEYIVSEHMKTRPQTLLPSEVWGMQLAFGATSIWNFFYDLPTPPEKSTKNVCLYSRRVMASKSWRTTRKLCSTAGNILLGRSSHNDVRRAGRRQVLRVVQNCQPHWSKKSVRMFCSCVGFVSISECPAVYISSTAKKRVGSRNRLNFTGIAYLDKDDTRTWIASTSWSHCRTETWGKRSVTQNHLLLQTSSLCIKKQLWMLKLEFGFRFLVSAYFWWLQMDFTEKAKLLTSTWNSKAPSSGGAIWMNKSTGWCASFDSESTVQERCKNTNHACNCTRRWFAWCMSWVNIWESFMDLSDKPPFLPFKKKEWKRRDMKSETKNVMKNKCCLQEEWHLCTMTHRKPKTSRQTSTGILLITGGERPQKAETYQAIT